ncbi:MAG: YraN family protein [Acidobacteria bacterium]|nr:YraN family protein [Acidobacteriota bacterium]
MWDISKRYRRRETVRPHLELGERGEQIASEFLQQLGFRIVARNFIAPIGSGRNGRRITGEIDLIAYDQSTRPFVLTFVEVKTRSSAELAVPESAIDLRKRRHIIRASKVYRRMMGVENEPYRFDIVTILINPQSGAEVKLLRGFFHDRMFRHQTVDITQGIG